MEQLPRRPEPAPAPAEAGDEGIQNQAVFLFYPLCPTLSRRERVLTGQQCIHRGCQILALPLDPEESQDWVDAEGYTVPLYVNNITDRGAVQVADDRDSLYFIKGTPMKFLIDKNGVLRKKVVGFTGEVTASDIRQLL